MSEMYRIGNHVLEWDTHSYGVYTEKKGAPGELPTITNRRYYTSLERAAVELANRCAYSRGKDLREFVADYVKATRDLKKALKEVKK